MAEEHVVLVGADDFPRVGVVEGGCGLPDANFFPHVVGHVGVFAQPGFQEVVGIFFMRPLALVARRAKGAALALVVRRLFAEQAGALGEVVVGLVDEFLVGVEAARVVGVATLEMMDVVAHAVELGFKEPDCGVGLLVHSVDPDKSVIGWFGLRRNVLGLSFQFCIEKKTYC